MRSHRFFLLFTVCTLTVCTGTACADIVGFTDLTGPEAGAEGGKRDATTDAGRDGGHVVADAARDGHPTTDSSREDVRDARSEAHEAATDAPVHDAHRDAFDAAERPDGGPDAGDAAVCTPACAAPTPVCVRGKIGTGCFECATATDCPPPPECARPLPTCMSNSCVYNPVTSGSPCSTGGVCYGTACCVGCGMSGSTECNLLPCDSGTPMGGSCTSGVCSN